MAPPPRHLVLEKLIKKYFKVGKRAIHPEALKYKMELLNCWEKYGGNLIKVCPSFILFCVVNHAKCTHLVDTFDYGWGLNIVKKDKYMQEIKE